MTLILTLVLGLFATSASAQVSCFVGENENGKLPDNAVVMTSEQWTEVYTGMRNLDRSKYLPASFCQKSHTRSIVKEVRTGNEQTDVMFMWGGTEPRLTSEEIWGCNDNPQSTHGLRFPDNEVVIYNHQCNCCGTSCNGKAMDGRCNETPQFTHSCYSSGFEKVVTTPELPADAVVVPATAGQFCYKLAHYNSTMDTTFYMWGATNLGTKKKCGDSRKMVTGSSTIQICTCCGPLCNGATMNSMNAKEACAAAPPPTTTPKVVVAASSGSTLTVPTTLLLIAVIVKLL